MLVEGAVEWIIEGVVAVVNGDWEMIVAILEPDAVCGVVSFGDFTVYLKFIHNYHCHQPGKSADLGNPLTLYHSIFRMNQKKYAETHQRASA